MADPTSSANPKQISLVKFDKPEAVASKQDKRGIIGHGAVHVQLPGHCSFDDGLDDALIEKCREAQMSQIETSQILNSIAPPREYEEDGKRWRQFISKHPATRTDILDLNEALNDQLTNRQARPDGICPIRRELADQTFDELIRQIAISQPERGLLLLRVRDELRMTLSAYQDLFVSSRDYDPYKNVLKESFTHKTEMEEKLAAMEEVVNELQKERDEMLKVLECEDHVFKESSEASNKKHTEEFQFLKRVNNVLKTHMEQMLDTANNIDPVIDAFDPHPSNNKNRQRKGKKDKCKTARNEKPPTT